MKKLAVFLAIVMFASSAFAGIMGANFDFQQPNGVTINPVHSKTVTTNTTLTLNDDMVYVNTTSAAITITLPAIYATSGVNGKAYTIINSGTTGYVVTVAASTTDSVTNTIEAAASRKIFIPNGKMVIKLNSGTDWDVLYETPPVAVNMYTGVSTASGQLLFNAPLVTAPTVSTVYTFSDCGKVIPVATDALTITLPKITFAGCRFTFINTATAGAAILDIKANAADAFYGTIPNPGNGVGVVITSPTGSTLSNTKTTAKAGDSVDIMSSSSGSWFITRVTGTWTTK